MNPVVFYILVLWTLNSFIVIFGYNDLSANKNTTQYKILPNCFNCDASNAVDRNINTCALTEMGITAPDQYTRWDVDLGDVQSVHNIRIQFRAYEPMYDRRQRGRFAGFSLYVSNTTDRNSGFLCYKDGPELPPLDFTTNCTIRGRYVIFYNERLNGIKYPSGYEPSNVVTELCEVTVTGCSTHDVYACEKPCPDNCEESRCDATNGTCFGCTPGWIGEYCQTSCPDGYYGLKCKSECIGVCKDEAPCNHINGSCDNGCYDGWTGEKCTEVCPTGTFGTECVFNCSENCLGDITCNRTTGQCEAGCRPGYTGAFCDKGCENGKFGIRCSNHCSGNCLNKETCNSTYGHCDNGCAPGYLEAFCNNTCDKRTYGLDCLQHCSINCMDGLCNNVDGSCICTYGKKGSPYCNETNLQSDVLNDCNESFYIAGLSILIIISILLGMTCLLFLRKYYRLVKKVRSLQYASITRTSVQAENNAKDGQQYEELCISENSYHNIDLNN